MTLPQFFAFAIVGAMMALFVWGRLRYDLVAMLALLAAIADGVVAPKDAFSGFSDDIVIIVASALLVVGRHRPLGRHRSGDARDRALCALGAGAGDRCS